jgi:hypothetical protein
LGQDCTHFDIQDYAPQITTLDLSHNADLFLSPRTLNDLSKISLHSLYLHGVNNSQEAVIQQIIAHGSSRLNQTLSTLDISYYSMNSKKLQSLVSSLPNLIKLGIHNSKLNDYAFNTLLTSCGSQLKYIDASNNKITHLTMLESWTYLPEKPSSPKKLAKQFSFSSLSTSPISWVINIESHQIFQPPIAPDRPSFILDLRNNPLSPETFTAFKMRFHQAVYELTDSIFAVFYNTETQTYILTDLSKAESPTWIKA